MLKKPKNRTCSFTGHLITLFSTQLPKVGTDKLPTSNMLLRNADTRNYGNFELCVCGNRL